MSGRRLTLQAVTPAGALRWLLAAALLAIAAAAVDRETRIEVRSDGGRLEVAAAGSSLSAPLVVESLTAVGIRAADSIDPPGGARLMLSDGRGVVLEEALPRRFRIPDGAVAPLGDWEIDARLDPRPVWRRELEVAGPFELEAWFRGRFLDDLEIVLEGRPGARVAVRRGLINNDIFIRDAAGNDLAATSLDPTQLADLGAVAATVARAASLAALLIAALTAVAARARSRPLPAAVLRRRFAPLAVVLAVAAVALSAWVALVVLEGLPHTPDSVVYLLQARWLLEGALWGDVGPLHELLTVPYTHADGARWLAHYPPGWPALLAAGMAAGVPWLVAPLLGGIFVWLLYRTGCEIDGAAVGLVAAALGFISPLVRVLCGSLLSHAAAATLVLAAILLTVRAGRSGRWRAAAASGIAIGLVFSMRPATAAAAALPLAVVLLGGILSPVRRAPDLGLAAGFVGGAALGALPALLANHLVTGSTLAFPYTLIRGSMFGLENLPFGLRNLDALLASGGAGLLGWGWPWVHGPWVIALALSLALVPFLLRRAGAADLLLAAVAVCVMVVHLGTRGHGLHGFGPRYHFEAFAPLVLLTARGFLELARLGSEDGRSEKPLCVAAALGLFFALCLPAAAVLPQRLELYRGYNGVDGALETQIAARGLERALIVLPPGEWQGWAMAAEHISSRPDAPLLVVQAELDDPRVLEVAGDRRVYAWRDRTLVAVTRR
jgi:hypothetical protein